MNCMGHAVRQFEKEVSLILDQQQEKYFLTDALKKLVIASRFKKWPQPSLLSLEPKSKLRVH